LDKGIEASSAVAGRKLCLWGASSLSSQPNLIVSKPERTAVSRSQSGFQGYNQEIFSKKLFKGGAYHSSEDWEDNELVNLL